MIRVLDRYLFREVVVTALAVISVLLLAVFGNILARFLGRASDGSLPVDALLPLVLVGVARVFIMLIPFSMFLAVLMSMGRLYKDSEMTALRASGVGYRQLYRPLFFISLPLTALLVWLSFSVMPMLEQVSDRVKADMRTRSELVGITPGRFIESKSAGRVLFIESLSEDKSAMRNVFIHFKNHGRSSVVTATRAEQVINPQTGQRYLELKNGFRYEGVPGEGEYRIAQFGAYGVLVPRPQDEGTAVNRDAMSTAALWHSGGPKDMAELHWRMALPVSLLVLMLVAMPLSYTTPRQGRFGKLTIGILVYVIYANLFIMGEAWIAKGLIPAALGLWWVHLIMLVLTGGLLVRQYGWRWVLSMSGPRRGAVR